MALEAELKTYQGALPSLLAKAGKYVLIKGDDVLGLYDTYADAIQGGYEKSRLDPFMVKQIEAVEQVQFVSRSIEPCPT